MNVSISSPQTFSVSLKQSQENINKVFLEQSQENINKVFLTQSQENTNKVSVINGGVQVPIKRKILN